MNLQGLTGFNLKDTISNIGAGLSFAGSALLIGVESGNINIRYEKQAIGLVGLGALVVGYTTGKRGDLQAGQVDLVAPQFLVPPAKEPSGQSAPSK